MSTGIIRHLGIVRAAGEEDGAYRLVVESGDVAAAATLGDSIAINGACLTVTIINGDRLQFDVVPETLNRTNLGTLRPGQIVNVEDSMRAGDRLGGHLVYGHVDAVARVEAKDPEGPGFRLRFMLPPGLRGLIVEKGYVALDGVSLTVAKANRTSFEVVLVPETVAGTTFAQTSVEDNVNVEADPIARYVAAAVSSRK